MPMKNDTRVSKDPRPPHGRTRLNLVTPKTDLWIKLRDFPTRTSTVTYLCDFAGLQPSPATALPYFETVQAGFPSPAEDFEDRRLDLTEFLVRNHAATFLLKVSGESMTGAGIFDGDILVVDRSLEPKDGDIVIACIENEFTVKRLRRFADRVVLQAENPAVPSIEVVGDIELHLFGVVTSSVKQFRK
jgi:DNA polymerase V